MLPAEGGGVKGFSPEKPGVPKAMGGLWLREMVRGGGEGERVVALDLHASRMGPAGRGSVQALCGLLGVVLYLV